MGAGSRRFKSSRPVIRHDGNFKLIMDAKYKKKSSESDRYQIIAHALSYGVNKAVLVMPASDGIAPGLFRIGALGSDFEVELFEYYINLESPDLENEEAAYVQVMKDLCFPH